ncbi:MAG: hypothetical protein AB3K77_15145, partial [Methanosarcinaceae archaeon]
LTKIESQTVTASSNLNVHSNSLRFNSVFVNSVQKVENPEYTGVNKYALENQNKLIVHSATDFQRYLLTRKYDSLIDQINSRVLSISHKYEPEKAHGQIQGCVLIKGIKGNGVQKSVPINSDIFYSEREKGFHFQVFDKDLVFKAQGKIEQRVEQIEKILFESKSTSTKNIEAIPSIKKQNLLQHPDLHHISEQVYQMIDQRIKIEAERRGIS